ncbi:MAG TPA: glycine/betaine ABC transporter permease, partial [Microbacterium sp.]|nr:glycine/betaine ABC transporter permease [Microbacterium sp.]
MENLRLPLGAWVEALLDFIGAVFGWLFDAIALALGAIYEGLDWVLVTPPFWLIIIALAALAYWVKGWKLALGTALGLLLIVLLDQWENAMDTLALVLVAAAIAIIISIPVGIWAARNDTVSRIVRPIL